MRRWLLVGVGVLVGAVVLVSAGTWVYLNVVRDPPAERLSLDSSPSPSSPSTSSPSGDGVDGTWTVAAGTSQAGYRVPEVLNGQSTEAVGRTTDVTGSLTIVGTRATAGSFEVDMTTVASDESRRDNQFRGRIMDVANHPTSTFELTAPIDFGSVPADGVRISASATGRLTLRGTTKDVTFDVDAERAGDDIRIAGSIPLTFSDYGIPNPSAGPAQVGDEGELELLLVLTRA